MSDIVPFKGKNSSTKIVADNKKGLNVAKYPDVAIGIDCSGSMEERINGRMLFSIAMEVVDEADFAGIKKYYLHIGRVTEHKPLGPDGSTPLEDLIDRMCKDGFSNLVIVSDGLPDRREAVINIAKEWQKKIGPKFKISTIYIGPDGYSSAKEFLMELARTFNGKSAVDLRSQKQDLGLLLGQTIKMLLPAHNGGDNDGVIKL